MLERHVMDRVAGLLKARRALWVIAAFLYPVLGSVPSHAALFSDDEARKAAADLRAEVLQMRTAQETRLTRIESSVDAIQKTLDRLDQAVKGIPALQSQIDAVGTDLANLRGEIEVQRNANTQLEKRNKELYLDIDSRLKVLEQGLSDLSAKLQKPPEPERAENAKPTVANTDPEVAPTPKAEEPKNTPAPPTAAEQKAYDQAIALFKANNFVASAKSFQSFLKVHAGSALEPNAEFWLGVSHYRLKAYTAAENAFKELIKKHPDSPKAPDALYNLANAELDGGNAEAAHDTLDDLISRYPGTDAAAKAKARLGRK